MAEKSFYQLLDLSQQVSGAEIRSAFRKLVLTKHPDQGGDEEEFRDIQRAYEILSDPRKRRIYDRFGSAGLEKSAETLLAESFKAGAFAPDKQQSDLRHEIDSLRRENESLQRQLMIVKPQENNFASSFEAWLRNRDPKMMQVVTTDDIARVVGAEEIQAERRPLPKLESYSLNFCATGRIQEAIELKHQALPESLGWGQVLVNFLAAPVGALDRHLAQWGMIPGEVTAPDPFVAGSHGVGVVIEVGEGVRGLRPHDLVIACHPFAGTWRPLGVLDQHHLQPVPPTDVGPALLANFFSFVTAYRLLEDFGSLLPGDSIIQTGPETSVGQAVISLASLLGIKTINLLDDRDDFQEVVDALHALGATHVWKNEPAVVTRLEKSRTPKPRLAIDSRGGASLRRMLDCLRPGSTLVCIGADSMEPTPFPYPPLLYQGIEARGFWLYRWLEDSKASIPETIDLLLPLLEEGKLRMEFTVWEDLPNTYKAMAADSRINPVLKLGDLEQAAELVSRVGRLASTSS